jgi:uncharacterized coiled-coil protein SlyX
MPEFDQQTVEAFRAGLDDLEARVVEEDRILDGLSGREREHRYWNNRRRWREIKALRTRLEDLEEDLFAMSVLGDLKGL